MSPGPGTAAGPRVPADFVGRTDYLCPAGRLGADTDSADVGQAGLLAQEGPRHVTSGGGLFGRKAAGLAKAAVMV